MAELKRNRLRAEVADETDIPRLMEIQFRAFANEPTGAMLNGPDTAEKRDEAGERLRWQMRNDPTLHVIKCLLTVDDDCGSDGAPTSAAAVAAGFCMWNIYVQERVPEEWMKGHELMAGDWVEPADKRDAVKEVLRIMEDGRRRTMQGRPYALLMYMCVDPAYWRRGVGGTLLKWGMARCDELGIPGYLEASDMGYPMYKHYGWRDTKEPLMVPLDGKMVKYPTLLWGKY